MRTPDGQELAVFGQELASEVGRRHGSPAEMMHLKRGIFDDASLSVIASATVNEVARLAAQPSDLRRFRPNILMASTRPVPFEGDDWVGGLHVDPDSARPNPEVLKAIVRAGDNRVWVYEGLVRRGPVAGRGRP